jgi:hypothetical protein
LNRTGVVVVPTRSTHLHESSFVRSTKTRDTHQQQHHKRQGQDTRDDDTVEENRQPSPAHTTTTQQHTTTRHTHTHPRERRHGMTKEEAVGRHAHTPHTHTHTHTRRLHPHKKRRKDEATRRGRQHTNLRDVLQNQLRGLRFSSTTFTRNDDGLADLVASHPAVRIVGDLPHVRRLWTAPCATPGLRDETRQTQGKGKAHIA